MNSASGWRIDWRNQFDSLEPHMCGSAGAVIHVRTSPQAPTSAFTRAVKAHLQASDAKRRWRVLHIDQGDFPVDGVDDLLVRLLEAWNLELPMPPPANGVGSIHIAEDIRSRGSVNISNVTAILGGASADEAAYRQAQRLRQIRASIEAKMVDVPLAVIMSSVGVGDMRPLRRLWRDVFHPLTSRGLLFIHVFDTTALPHSPPEYWPPDPNVITDIPDRFDTHSAEHAAQDLASLARHMGIAATDAEALMFARTLLSAADTIRDLHALLALSVGRLAMGRDF